MKTFLSFFRAHYEPPLNTKAIYIPIPNLATFYKDFKYLAIPDIPPIFTYSILLDGSSLVVPIRERLTKYEAVLITKATTPDREVKNEILLTRVMALLVNGI